MIESNKAEKVISEETKRGYKKRTLEMACRKNVAAAIESKLKIPTRSIGLFPIGFDSEADPANAPYGVKMNECSIPRPRIILWCDNLSYVAYALNPEAEKKGGDRDFSTVLPLKTPLEPFYLEEAFHDFYWNDRVTCVFITNGKNGAVDALSLNVSGACATGLTRDAPDKNCGKTKLLEKIRSVGSTVPITVCWLTGNNLNEHREMACALRDEIIQLGGKATVFGFQCNSIQEYLRKDPEGFKSRIQEIHEWWRKQTEDNLRQKETAKLAVARTFEHNESVRFYSVFTALFPEFVPFLIRVVNEAAQSSLEGRGFKEEGLRAGVPDYILLVPRGGFSALLIEMKKKDGGSLRPEQEIFIKRIKNDGHYEVVVCHGADEAIQAVSSYLALGEPCFLPEAAAPQLHPMENNSTAPEIPTINLPVVSVNW